MQHAARYFALPLAVLLCAPALAAPEGACRQLGDALGRQLRLLQSVKDAPSAAATLPELETVLAELAAMDRSPEAQKELWLYIENTPGVKQPLIELVQLLCVELVRLQKQDFYGHEGLRAALAPQLPPPVPAS